MPPVRSKAKESNSTARKSSPHPYSSGMYLESNVYCFLLDSDRRACIEAKGKAKAKAKPRNPHLDDEFQPNKAGHLYDDTCVLSGVVNQYLRQMIQNAEMVVTDYDLAVAFFLEETGHLKLGNIPNRQHDLQTCALHIKHTIEVHLADPASEPPFGLRYPNIHALHQLTKERSKSPRALRSNKAVIVVDSAGRLLLINLPPKSMKKKGDDHKKKYGCSEAPSEVEEGMTIEIGPKKTKDMSSELGNLEQVLKAFEGAARLHALPTYEASRHESVSNIPSYTDIQPRLLKAKNSPVPILGAVYGSLPYEAFGYPLGSSHDTKMQLGLERQGYTLDDVGEGPASSRYLPVVMGLGEESLLNSLKMLDWRRNRTGLTKCPGLLMRLCSPRPMRLLNTLSASFKKTRVLCFLIESRVYTIKSYKRQINYNMQVAPHQDGKNSDLLDSVFIYGKGYTGGRMVFGSLGVSVCGDPGYSTHGRFKFLDHAVSPILALSGSTPPLRISLALYSHADVYSGAARQPQNVATVSASRFFN
ncbi:uncharacterized protein MELLADRAFT_62535 [Melampsora larici-populina 98AG31]|uniref:Uncharacterized protein n=1 Tax=Melampsora larici-populina (strain 98AG31 / pathotype 3-4-7) TaxID=747676 RepID=F4RJ97_MELLP|nr:uncharacterized protein MELLADRAFT_62535 [Melampsora larici-populina 98AG31]EGG07539.1 hypothetical protein MELLADRAFT_62535 [Melampsora larici-populina 98AG31]